MGTSMSGRYMNTQGSGRHVSDFALIHSDEGTYIHPVRKKDKFRLKSGGHGQTGMDQLIKYKIGFTIVKTFPNGVRIGRIENHKAKAKREKNR